jgi:hypothetical protein
MIDPTLINQNNRPERTKRDEARKASVSKAIRNAPDEFDIKRRGGFFTHQNKPS